MVSLLDHQEEDDCPDDSREPCSRQGALQSQVVCERDVLKVPHVTNTVVLVVPEALVLGVELVVAVVLLQFVVICSVSQQGATRNGVLKPKNKKK